MFDARVNVRGILDRFDRMKRRDKRRSMAELRKPLRDDVRDHAKKQAAPSGKWPARAASTMERRARSKKRRGKLLGRLPYAYRITVGPDFVRAVWLVRWSGVHRRGGRVGRGGRVPARDFAWISRRLRRQARDMLRASVMRAWRSR